MKDRQVGWAGVDKEESLVVYTRGTTRLSWVRGKRVTVVSLSIVAVSSLLHPHTQPLTGTQDLFLTFTYEYGFSFFIVSLFLVLKLKGASNHYHCVVAVIVVIVMYERWTKGKNTERTKYTQSIFRFNQVGNDLSDVRRPGLQQFFVNNYCRDTFNYQSSNFSEQSSKRVGVWTSTYCSPLSSSYGIVVRGETMVPGGLGLGHDQRN
ncbi:Uncharacterized protein FWK35_00020453 [Aphis craccivora]|uniref:Uncharacterized protein n=1 Tax=Aphis craccivora TaxID=307492 RepID=A0A6G0Z8D6_APHCR|nr:Uncharacterized protein FWK35_00020453 [Aphis craccivora]